MGFFGSGGSRPGGFAVFFSVAFAAAGARADAGPFAPAVVVEIEGYGGHAMEPFISHDDRWLFFNDKKSRGEKDVHYAERLEPRRFAYRGIVAGADGPGVDGVPSMDRAGNFYFVSMRRYRATFESVFRGAFAQGKLSGVRGVEGLSWKRARWINMDFEISPDGGTLYYTQTRFSPWKPWPDRSNIYAARRRGGGFEPLPETERIFANVNSNDVEYAPSVSADGKELFFSRVSFRFGLIPRFELLRSVRSGPGEPFGPPEVLVAGDGVIEGPSLSADGTRLYYHRKIDGRFRIVVAERRRAG